MSTGIDPASLLTALFAGGSITMLLFIAIHLVWTGHRKPDVFFAIIMCLTTAAEVVSSVPVMEASIPEVARLAAPVGAWHTIFLWWFALALFEDGFQIRPWHLTPAIVLVALKASALPLVQILSVQHSETLIIFLNIGLFVHILVRAVFDYSSDLVDERRRFRMAVTSVVPTVALFITGAELYELYRPVDARICVLHCAATLLVSFVFGLWLTRVHDIIFSSVERDNIHPRKDVSAVDRIELEKLKQLVEAGTLLEIGTTVGSLADQMGLPEHRLRKLINNGLGYRNFASFLHDHRISEAKRRLADPALAREQIIQHAFSLGYASLAPFNRAFRERVGLSPTQFREQALGTGLEAHSASA